MKPKVAIFGLGLVGGSLARALARRGYPVSGVDRSAAALTAARRSRAFVLVTRSPERALVTDRPLLITVLLFAGVTMAIIYRWWSV